MIAAMAYAGSSALMTCVVTAYSTINQLDKGRQPPLRDLVLGVDLI